MTFSEHDCFKIVKNLPEALVLVDPEENILDVNRRACKILGYTRKELLGMSVEDIVPEDEPVYLAGQVGEATKTGTSLETVNVRKDGKKVPVELRGKVLKIGEEEKMLVSIRDIRQRKEKEESIEGSEEKYKTIFESANDAIFIMKGSKFVDCNEKALEVFGYDRDEIIGQPPWEFSPESQPDGINSKERAKEKIQRALSGEPQFFEWAHTKADGKTLWTEVNLNSYKVEGERFLMAIVRDVTGRKEAERELKQANKKLEESRERYRSYFEKLGDAIFVTKAGGEDHGQILEVNSTAVEQTGYSREELLGMNIENDFAITSDRLGSNISDIDSLPDGEILNFVEKKRKKDGTEYWTEVVVTPMEHEGKDAALSINRDITDRKRAQEALSEEREKLRSLHDAVDDLQRQNSEEEVARTAVNVSERMLDFEICDISLVEGEYIVTKASSTGIDQGQDTKFKITEGLAGKTFRTGETIWGDDISKHPDAKPIDEGFKAFISAPIGELGVFQVISREESNFNERDVELAEILAGHLREEFRRVRLEKQLRQQAIRDPLTDLYNRRYFNESLQKEVERCKRYDNFLAFLMLDINRFKEINDRYTHQIGDRVLKEVAKLLKENVRKSDTVVRYGGDEFLIMMPETHGEIESIEERISRELARWNNQSDLLDFPLTLAMGMAHWEPDQDRDVEKALKEADRRMYRDKET